MKKKKYLLCNLYDSKTFISVKCVYLGSNVLTSTYLTASYDRLPYISFQNIFYLNIFHLLHINVLKNIKFVDTKIS